MDDMLCCSLLATTREWNHWGKYSGVIDTQGQAIYFDLLCRRIVPASKPISSRALALRVSFPHLGRKPIFSNSQMVRSRLLLGGAC